MYLLWPQLSQSGVFAVSSVESVWCICYGLTGLVSSTALHRHWADLFGITLVFAVCVTHLMKPQGFFFPSCSSDVILVVVCLVCVAHVCVVEEIG